MTTPAPRVRAGLAGATGYAGQELIRLLARHPQFVLTHATGSPSATTTRRLPALARVWDGDVVPLDVASLAAASDVVFLALPEAASAEWSDYEKHEWLVYGPLQNMAENGVDAAHFRYIHGTASMPNYDVKFEGIRRVASVAAKVGYGSAFALSTAFKRVHGVSPAEHRKHDARATREHA